MASSSIQDKETHLLDIQEPKQIIPRLCASFYHLGWVSGTGGGLSVSFQDRVYVAPSGVQKELIRPEDIFTLNLEGKLIETPCSSTPERPLKQSECTPLFLIAYQMRKSGAVIHSHHISCSILTQIIHGNEFKISHQEMIKGIRKGSTGTSLRYDDQLVVPIIENTPFERDLVISLRTAIENYPDTNAVLVRRHGVYIWGQTWIEAKTMAECYHYLFETAIRLHQFNLPLVKE